MAVDGTTRTLTHLNEFRSLQSKQRAGAKPAIHWGRGAHRWRAGLCCTAGWQPGRTLALPAPTMNSQMPPTEWAEIQCTLRTSPQMAACTVMASERLPSSWRYWAAARGQEGTAPDQRHMRQGVAGLASAADCGGKPARHPTEDTTHMLSDPNSLGQASISIDFQPAAWASHRVLLHVTPSIAPVGRCGEGGV